MSKQDLKKKTNRAWDVVNLLSCAVGGAILTFSVDTQELYRNVTLGQLVGSVLIATVVARVAHLIYKEER